MYLSQISCLVLSISLSLILSLTAASWTFWTVDKTSLVTKASLTFWAIEDSLVTKASLTFWVIEDSLDKVSLVTKASLTFWAMDDSLDKVFLVTKASLTFWTNTFLGDTLTSNTPNPSLTGKTLFCGEGVAPSLIYEIFGDTTSLSWGWVIATLPNLSDIVNGPLFETVEPSFTFIPVTPFKFLKISSNILFSGSLLASNWTWISVKVLKAKIKLLNNLAKVVVKELNNLGIDWKDGVIEPIDLLRVIKASVSILLAESTAPAPGVLALPVGAAALPAGALASGAFENKLAKLAPIPPKIEGVLEILPSLGAWAGWAAAGWVLLDEKRLAKLAPNTPIPPKAKALPTLPSLGASAGWVAVGWGWDFGEKRLAKPPNIPIPPKAKALPTLGASAGWVAWAVGWEGGRVGGEGGTPGACEGGAGAPGACGGGAGAPGVCGGVEGIGGVVAGAPPKRFNISLNLATSVPANSVICVANWVCISFILVIFPFLSVLRPIFKSFKTLCKSLSLDSFLTSIFEAISLTVGICWSACWVACAPFAWASTNGAVRFCSSWLVIVLITFSIFSVLSRSIFWFLNIAWASFIAFSISSGPAPVLSSCFLISAIKALESLSLPERASAAVTSPKVLLRSPPYLAIKSSDKPLVDSLKFSIIFCWCSIASLLTPESSRSLSVSFLPKASAAPIEASVNSFNLEPAFSAAILISSKGLIAPFKAALNCSFVILPALTISLPNTLKASLDGSMLMVFKSSKDLPVPAIASANLAFTACSSIPACLIASNLSLSCKIWDSSSAICIRCKFLLYSSWAL